MRKFPTPSRLYWAARTAGYVAAEHRIPYLPREKLLQLRDARARRIVKHAYETVPFYRREMDQRRLKPGDIRSSEDLAQLPVISGQDLAEDPLQFVSSAYPKDRLLELTTSGSSGHSKHVFWDKAAIFRAHATGLRHRDVLSEFVGRRSGYRMVRIHRGGGTGHEVQAFHQAHSWVPAIADPLTVNLSPREPFAEAVQVINDHEPVVIRGFGACIGAIYRWAWAGGHRIFRPKVICYGGEHMPQHDRELIESEYGIPVITSYQACEALRIAFQCERAEGLHISVDQTDVRIADSDGATLPPGETGRVLISNLVNRATVLLNYDLGDLGTMAVSACSCGRTLPVLDRLEGRADDMVKLPGGEAAHESVVLSRLYGVPGVMRIQIIQTSIEDFRIKVVRSEGQDWNSMQNELTVAMENALEGRPFRVQWEPVDHIDAEPSGKFKSVISLAEAT